MLSRKQPRTGQLLLDIAQGNCHNKDESTNNSSTFPIEVWYALLQNVDTGDGSRLELDVGLQEKNGLPACK